MAGISNPQTRTQLVRFWAFYWPMFAVGLLASAIASGFLVPLGQMLVGEGMELWRLRFAAWEGGSVGARTAFLPLLLAAAIVASPFASGGAVPYNFPVLLSVIIGLLCGLYRGGEVETALLGALIGVPTGLAMWSVGVVGVSKWPGESMAEESDA